MKLSERQKARLESQWEYLAGLPDGLETMCDLGAESGLSGKQLRERWPEAWICGVDAVPVEVSGPYNVTVKDDALLHMDVTGRLGGYDLVVCAELIEHYTREAGEALLVELERNPRVLLTTPIGFMPQGAIGGNPHQVHLSGWEPSDFLARGWSVPVIDERHNYFLATWAKPN